MKVTKQICVFLMLAFAVLCNAEEKYTTKYDNIDLDDLVKNERLLKNYMDCLLEKGPCTPDASELRKNMPDAVETDCSKCSEKQKEGSEFIMRYLIDNKPEYWNALEVKYDPSGNYKKAYLESKKDNVDVKPTSK